MKYLIALLLSGFLTYGFSQKTFKVNSNAGRKISIKINGHEYNTIDSSYRTITTASSVFDTLQISGGANSYETKILCDFKHDSSYTFILACCGSIDIVPSWKLSYDSLKIWSEQMDTNYEAAHFKFQSWFMDHPKITFRIKNGSAKDSIYAWYSDHACFPSFKLIDENGWKYGSPIKCYYWSNISFFEFFKTKAIYDEKFINQGIIEDHFPDYSEKLGVIATRLFDDGWYSITYDLKTRQIILTQDD